MTGIIKRLRGIIGTGITWALGWAGALAALHLLTGASLQFIGQIALSGMVRGFIAGGAFAVILSIAERRHTLEDLSLRRIALWGGIGGSLLFVTTLPLLLQLGIPLGSILVPLAINGLLGAGFATGSVALARRAETTLIEGGDDQLLSLEGD